MVDNSPRRKEILDTAINLFASEGYGKSTVRKIAEKVGIDNSTLFYYFKRKDDMLQALLEEYKGLFAACRFSVGELVEKAKRESLTDVLINIYHPIAPAGLEYERAINLYRAIESLKHEHEDAKRVYTECTLEGSRKYIESVFVGLIEAGLCKPIDTFWASYYFHSLALRLHEDLLFYDLDYAQAVEKYISGVRMFCGFFEQILKP